MGDTTQNQPKQSQFNWGGIAGNAINSGVGAIMGLALQKHNNRVQLEQQGKLQRQQMEGSKEMMDYQQGLALQHWKDTGVKAQMEQLKAAGLNPALMYNSAGGGGGQTITPSASTQGGQAAQGGREIQEMMGMQLQNKMMQAQIKLAESQAQKNTVEAENIAGVDRQKTGQEITNLQQALQNMGAEQKLTEMRERGQQLQNEFDAGTMQHRKGLIYEQYEQAEEITAMLRNQREVSDATKDEQIKQVGAELADTIAGAILKTKQGELAVAQTGKTQKEAELLFKDYLLRQWQTEEGISTQHQNNRESANRVQMNDVPESTKQTYDAFGKLLQGLGIGSILSRGGTTPIQGFNRR